jgi:hypothetical protein
VTIGKVSPPSSRSLPYHFHGRFMAALTLGQKRLKESGLGFTGREEGIASLAVATIRLPL